MQDSQEPDQNNQPGENNDAPQKPVEETRENAQNATDAGQTHVSSQTTAQTPPPPINPVAAQYPPAPPPGFYGYAAPASEPKKSFFQGWLFKTLGGALVSLFIFMVIMGLYMNMLSSAVSRSGMQEKLLEGKSETAQKITVIPIDGMIGGGTKDFVKRSLKLLSDKTVKPSAVILRINSPGGGLTASDQIAQMLNEYSEEHQVPMIASYGSISASGGVYISAGCDQIVAENTTMTGSIGVIAQAFTYGDLLEKVGVTPETVVANGSPKKGVLDGSRKWTDDDRAVLKKFLDNGQKMFTDQIRKGRKDRMTDEQFAQATTGEPFTSQEALDLGLIDKIGYLEDAIELAKKTANLSGDVKVTKIIEKISPLEQFMSLKSSEVNPESVNPEQLKQLLSAEGIRSILVELSTPKIEARMP